MEITQKYADIETNDKAQKVAGWLVDKKAVNVVALDVSKVCATVEAVVIATARSPRQAKALADHLRSEAKTAKLEFMGMEGESAGQWVLVDLNDVVAHIFLKDVREFFNLEGLWSKAEPVCFLAADDDASEDGWD